MALKSFPSSYRVSRERNGHSVTELFLPCVLIRVIESDVGCLSDEVFRPTAYAEWERNQKLVPWLSLCGRTSFMKRLPTKRTKALLKMFETNHNSWWRHTCDDWKHSLRYYFRPSSRTYLETTLITLIGRFNISFMASQSKNSTDALLSFQIASLVILALLPVAFSQTGSSASTDDDGVRVKRAGFSLIGGALQVRLLTRL